MYMSYCRYEGTLQEIRACLSDADEHINGEAEYKVSDDEIRHFKNMITEIYEWMNDQALINEYGELDEDELDRICEAMQNATEEE